MPEPRPAIASWSHEYGAALKPSGADTYGEGMRDAKQQVAAILSATDWTTGYATEWLPIPPSAGESEEG